MQSAVRFLKTRATGRPKIGIVLGSGLGDFAEPLKAP
jgi:purine nucleoside phosphorylase